MKEKNISIKEIIGKYGEMNIMSGSLIILFFVVLISGYYLKMYSATKESIISKGEARALKAAQQFASYIDTEKIIVEQEKFTTEKLLDDDRSRDEIAGYMKAYTNMVQTEVSDKISDVYGYIHGQYYDGTGWIPDADYNPEERPWYKAAMENAGHPVLVEPYVDARLGSITMTVAQTLDDGESVVAVDLNFDMLKEVIGEETDGTADSVAFVLNSRGDVLAHSDDEEIGRNYKYEADTLGASVAKVIYEAYTECFEVTYGGKDYVAYVVPIGESWYSVSLIDSRESYRPLRIMFFVTLFLLLISTAVLAMLFYDLMSKTVTLGYEKRRSNELEEMTEKAMAASEAKSSFLSNMSHEIRTPINAMMGMNEMIIRESTDRRAVEYAYSVRTAGDTLLGIINDVLDLSKIEAGKFELVPVDYELSTVLNDLVNMTQTRAAKKGLTLELDFDAHTPNQLYGDEVRLKQIMMNLLTNAVKYTEKGTITLGVSYEDISDEAEQVNLKIYVRDTGVGLTQEDMDRLFDEFERLDDEHNRKIEETGLGMSITRSLLEMMGSSISVKSEYGKGSEFSFVLKQKVRGTQLLGDYVNTYRNSQANRTSDKGLFTAPDAHILMVDDMKVNLKVFEKLLKRTKIVIDTALDGDSGLELALRKKYDVIFLDHMMPDKDGIETLKELKAHKNGKNKSTPVICLTANAVAGAREMYLGEGFDDYITKPIVAQKLEEMLIAYLPGDKVIYKQSKEEQAAPA